MCSMVAIALAAAPARADQKSSPTVAVVVTSSVNISAGEKRTLTAAMGRGLRSALIVEVLPVADVDKRIGGAPPEGCLNQTSCVQQLISQLGTSDILALSLVRVGTAYQVQVTAIDTADGGLSPRGQIRVEADADLASAFAAEAPRLLPNRVSVATNGDGRRFTTGVWIASGVSLASLGVATFLGVRAHSRNGDCKDAVYPRLCSGERLDSIDRDALLADVGFALAAGAAVTAGVLYWFSDSRDESRPMVTVGRQTATIGWAGSF
jgi:hypothetical protein